MERKDRREFDFDKSLENPSRTSDLPHIEPTSDAPLAKTDSSKLHQENQGWSFRMGPIPAPEELEAYNRAIPDLGNKLVQSFFDETEHRREIERRELQHQQEMDREDVQLQKKYLDLHEKLTTGSQSRSNRGLAAGFVIGVLALTIGGGLAYTGHNVAGSFIAGGTLPTLVAVFVGTLINKNRQQELSEANTGDSTDTSDK